MAFRRIFSKIGKEFDKAVEKSSKVDTCFLCGRKMKKACNSHVVPRFILKQITEDGHISYGTKLQKIDINKNEKTTGINNSHTFFLICDVCDKTLFRHYENPRNIVDFEKLDLNTQKLVLCEMAIKTHLSHIYMKYLVMVRNNIASFGEYGRLEQEGKLIAGERLDINEHDKYIDMLNKYIKSNKNPFAVIYNKVLNYKTKLATQTIINYNFDLEGHQIFDPYLITNQNKCRYFYLMILPFENQTRVMFYVEKKYLNNVQPVVEQFESLSDDEKLHFLFISLIINDEQFYMTPSFAQNIFKHDKKLVKLYCKTEHSVKYQSKIKDFRKYTNYLLKKYN